MKSLSQHITEKLIVNKNYKIYEYQEVIDIINNTDWTYEHNDDYSVVMLRSKSKDTSSKILNKLNEIYYSFDKDDRKHLDAWWQVNKNDANVLITKRENDNRYMLIWIYSDEKYSYPSEIFVTINKMDDNIKKWMDESYFKIPSELIKEIAQAVADKYNFEYLKR